MNLGKLGVWYSIDKMPPATIGAFVNHVEKLGYSTLWYPEARGHEAFTVGGYMLGASKTLQFGSSIANMYARDAVSARQAMRGLNTLYGGNRFVLGLGVSHRPMVEGVRGHTYGKPVPEMRAYLDAMERGTTDSADWPLALAALGPLMLKLAAARTRGALPYNVTPAHTAEAKAILGPDKWLAVEQKFCLETDPVRARALGRAELSRYMTLENYRNNWLRIGFTEAELANGGSDRFIDAMVLWGDVATVRRGIDAHFTAGATHVCIQPVHAEGDFAARDAMLAAMA
jgi:probable F420-dependent oxidoreductase